MRKQILVCDHCKKETEWLYNFYHIHIDGKLVTVDKEGYAEYCKECMLSLCDVINNYKAGTELKKPWIEKCCDIICPHCGYVFSDEIRLMGHGKELPLNFCPVCGKEVDDSKR